MEGKNYQALKGEVDEMRTKIKETAENVEYNAGVPRDIMRLVGPIMLDQLALTEEILDFSYSRTEWANPTRPKE